jgi:hypothetical protein
MENEIIDGYYGAILKTDERDWFFGDSSDLVLQKNYNTSTFEYNQLEFAKEFGNNLCTVYAPI